MSLVWVVSIIECFVRNRTGSPENRSLMFTVLGFVDENPDSCVASPWTHRQLSCSCSPCESERVSKNGLCSVRQINRTRFCQGVTWGGTGCWNSTLARTKVGQKASRTGPEDTSVGLYLRTSSSCSTSWSSDCSRNICITFHRFRILTPEFFCPLRIQHVFNSLFV